MESCARAELFSDALHSLKPQQDQVIEPLSASRKSTISDSNVEDNHNLKKDSDAIKNHDLQETVEKHENQACGIFSNDQVCLEPSIQMPEKECRIVGNIRKYEVDDSVQKSVGKYKRRFSDSECNHELPTIRGRKFELPELSRLFLGDTFRWIFTGTAALDLYGLTWSIAAVFASSLAAEFSIWNDEERDYIFFMALFAVAAVPLTFVPLISQVWIQIIFFAGRILMVFVMLGTLGAAYTSETSHFGTQLSPQRNTNLVNWNTLQV
jgi:hypothetical protein